MHLTSRRLEEESRGSAERSPLLEEDDEHLSSAAVFPSSGKTTISVEEYFEERVKTKLQYWQALAPRLSHRVALYEALIVLSSVLGTVLGALDQKLWIPFMVALGAAMNTLMHHEGLQARLSALNASIQVSSPCLRSSFMFPESSSSKLPRDGKEIEHLKSLLAGFAPHPSPMVSPGCR